MQSHVPLLFERFCDNVVNHVCTSNDETNVSHSRLCHVNFGTMLRLDIEV